MKGSKFNNTFEEAINLDDDDFMNIHSGGSSVVMLSREPLAKKKVKCHFEKGTSSVSHIVLDLIHSMCDSMYMAVKGMSYSQKELVGVESIEMLYCRICDDKKKIEEAIKKGLEDDANNDVVKEWSIKVRQLFNEKTVEHGDNSSPTNEATMKTPIKVAVNSEQNNFVKGCSFVKGSSLICNVQSTGRNNEKTKVVDGCDSPSVLFLEYKGNTSLDSLVVLTPGFLNMSDELWKGA
ncbi:unnamed protein product [Lactuca virosa]|uniref:Uncharacterized protein n=1 Tax=Lactuca virosa TaxID=75947 RepID=A0AAU9PEA5_9ASTR|nr:unnamed protein product [Lactuca virosa]